jgi:uncharacterized membrane protein
MAERRLDRPKGDERRFGLRRRRPSNREPDRFGRSSEAFARFMGTPRFLIFLTVFVAAWLVWNSIPLSAELNLRFDDPALYFTALTLLLSLQASYAAPLILLAQNRQDDRDRVAAEQDRQRAERSLADTEYLAREVAALRQAINETATRDFVRSELRALLEELKDDEGADRDDEPRSAPRQGR